MKAQLQITGEILLQGLYDTATGQADCCCIHGWEETEGGGLV